MEPPTPDLFDALTRHTDLLVAGAAALEDPSAPSLCAGWNVGHVLTHVARNGDALCALVRSAVDGTGETMYRSPEDRDADIDAGADRPVDVLVEDVRSTAELVNPALARLGPEHADVMVERVPGVPIAPAGRLAFMRLREVVYHHVDLDAGFGFEDVEPDLLLTFLDDEVARLGATDAPPDLTLTTGPGEQWTVGTGSTSVSGTRAELLGWLARGATTGLDADGVPSLPGGR